MSVDTGNLPMPPGRAQSRLGTWFDHHVYSLVASVGRMLRKPWATLLTVGVMAVALALPLGLWVALQNVQRFTGDVQQSAQTRKGWLFVLVTTVLLYWGLMRRTPPLFCPTPI